MVRSALGMGAGIARRDLCLPAAG